VHRDVKKHYVPKLLNGSIYRNVIVCICNVNVNEYVCIKL